MSCLPELRRIEGIHDTDHKGRGGKMNLRAVLFATSVFSLISIASYLPAAEWYVAASVADPNDGTSKETAFKAIQEGINAASDGDTVIVAQGTYRERVHFKGKNIVVRSTDPLFPSVVENTIIDGNKPGRIVAFKGTKDEGLQPTVALRSEIAVLLHERSAAADTMRFLRLRRKGSDR